MIGSFTHLHLHTTLSVADATLTEKQVAKRCKELGMGAAAITDHGVMFNCINFYKACQAEGIKPILGMETYVAPRSNMMREGQSDDANYHLVLLCETNEGYENLIKISSDASINGFYRKPRTDLLKLRKYHKGLIALSACLGGNVQQLILEDKYDEAKNMAETYDDIFGRGNFYLELQDHGLDEQRKVNEMLIKMSRETGIPLVVTNDCHYLTQDGAKAHDVLMAIQAKTTVMDSKRKKYGADQFYLKSPQEMYEKFSYIPEAINNTVLIAERCNVVLDFKKNRLPNFPLPDGTDKKKYLFDLVLEGATKRYGEITSDIQDRINYELETVAKMGFLDYFLIVWDFVKFAKDNDILVGPGRGSGAGSILLYCLNITEVDPLRYNLLFERFLDPSRVSMPDVDLDFQDDRRQEVVDYVTRKYGQESVCQIITFGKMAARSAIRNVGRALDYPFALYDTLSKMVPAEIGITLPRALEISQEMRAKYTASDEARALIDIAIQLEGCVLYTGTHAAGVLITDSKGVNAHVPTWKTDNGIVSQYSMNNLEDLGLLKADFLGLITLTVVSDAINAIAANFGEHIDLQKLYQCEDPAPLSLVADGFTDGIFQLEGGGMTTFMKNLRPKNIEEIIAGISLYRPGPMQYIPKYLENRRNENNIVYEFEALRPILSETYGIITYQEQCMRMVMALAGYQKHHSDSFRKAIAKKKADLIAQHREWFIRGRKADPEKGIDEIPGGIKMGYSKDRLEDLYNQMEAFGSYAFNKSHAAAYAIIGYVTAWLKFYYPAEFMAALMDSQIKNKAQVARYINHCKKDLNIPVLPPDINESRETFVADTHHRISYSLAGKGSNHETLEEICKERDKAPFVDFRDFLVRTAFVNEKKTFEALIAIGAFDKLGVVRSQAMAGLDDIMDRLQKAKSAVKRSLEQAKAPVRKGYKAKVPVTIDEKLNLDGIIPNIKEFPEEALLSLEKEYLGVYLSGHPLYRYMFSIQNLANFKTSDLDYQVDEETGTVSLNSEVMDGTRIQMFVVLNSVQELLTKKDKKQMGVAIIEDLTGICKAVIFPQLYESCKSKLRDGDVYKLLGHVKLGADEPPSIIVDGIEQVDAVLVTRGVFRVPNRAALDAVVEQLEKRSAKGNDPVYIDYNNIRILLKQDYWINSVLFKEYIKKDVSQYLEILKW